MCISVHIHMYNFKSQTTLFRLPVSEEEIDTKENKRRQIFLGPFTADDKIPQGRRLSGVPTALFASLPLPLFLQ